MLASGIPYTVSHCNNVEAQRMYGLNHLIIVSLLCRCFQIVRPGGMERPTDAYKETHNVTLSTEDTLFGGQVSNLQVHVKCIIHVCNYLVKILYLLKVQKYNTHVGIVRDSVYFFLKFVDIF